MEYKDKAVNELITAIAGVDMVSRCVDMLTNIIC